MEARSWHELLPRRRTCGLEAAAGLLQRDPGQGPHPLRRRPGGLGRKPGVSFGRFRRAVGPRARQRSRGGQRRGWRSRARGPHDGLRQGQEGLPGRARRGGRVLAPPHGQAFSRHGAGGGLRSARGPRPGGDRGDLRPAGGGMMRAAMPQPKGFRYEEREDGVALITLDRPDRLNALTFEVYAELRDLFAELPRRDEVRSVVITGSGRAFCSGGDVHDIIGPLLSRDMPGVLEFTRMTCDLVKNMRALRKPVIAAINGTTAGAGAAIALACDLRVAAAGSKIAFLFVKVGLAGADMGAAYLLPRYVGLAKATELLMLGDPITAEE